MGQALAAVLYSSLGLYAILIPLAVLYGLTAIVDLFIRVPHTKLKVESSVVNMIKTDIAQALHFVVKEKPILMKMSVIAFICGSSIYVDNCCTRFGNRIP